MLVSLVYEKFDKSCVLSQKSLVGIQIVCSILTYIEKNDCYTELEGFKVQ